MYSLGESTQKEYKKKNSKEHFLIGLLVPRFLVSNRLRYSWIDWLISLIIVGIIAASMFGGPRRR